MSVYEEEFLDYEGGYGEQEQASSAAQSQQWSGRKPIPVPAWAQETSSQQQTEQGVPERLRGRLSQAGKEPKEDTATTPAAAAGAGTEQQRKVLPDEDWQLLKAVWPNLLQGDDEQFISVWEPGMEQVLAERCPKLLSRMSKLLDVAVKCDDHFLSSKLAACLRRLWQYFGSVLAVPGSPFAEFSMQLASSAGFGSLSVNPKLPLMCLSCGAVRHSTAECRRLKGRLEAVEISPTAKEELLSQLVAHPAYSSRCSLIITLAATRPQVRRRRGQQASSAPAAAAAAAAGEPIEEPADEAAVEADPARMAASASAYSVAGLPFVQYFAPAPLIHPAAAAAGDSATLALVDEINRLRADNAQLQSSNGQLQHEVAELRHRVRMAQQLAGEYLTELNVQHKERPPYKRRR